MQKGKGWGSLAYWQSGEWQVVKERLKDETQSSPARADLFAALRAVHPGACRVAVLGQDPYPNRDHATGIAFSVPASCPVSRLPPTLVNIFREYQDDLGYPAPKNGDLTKWCEQGVLLWNVYPSCRIGKPGSHHWNEWEWLTREIMEKLDGRVVFIALGRVAGEFLRFVKDMDKTIVTSHPSPLGCRHGFLGSRIFTRTNSLLESLGKEPIDWRLDAKGEGNGQSQYLDKESTRRKEIPVPGEHFHEGV